MNLNLLDTMVAWQKNENCIKMCQQFCPGLQLVLRHAKLKETKISNNHSRLKIHPRGWEADQLVIYMHDRGF